MRKERKKKKKEEEVRLREKKRRKKGTKEKIMLSGKRVGQRCVGGDCVKDVLGLGCRPKTGGGR